MKIAIYGVSRSGKDYLIKKIVSFLNDHCRIKTCHLEGSKVLNELSSREFGCSFKYLSEPKKETLRKEFTCLINEMELEYQLVIVDGHYAFIKDDGYQVVFTESDRDVYDSFFYLDTPSKLIVQYSRDSEGEKKNLSITQDDIFKWKSYEKRELTSVCDALEKELIILDEDTESCLQFIKSYVTNYEKKYCCKTIAKKLVDKISEEIANKNEVIIFDCDKTVSQNDVTYDYCCNLDISAHKLKNIFRNDRYTSYQFFKVESLYRACSHAEISKASHDALSKVILSNDVIEYMSPLHSHYILGVTSGVYEIWDLISKKYNLFDSLYGNTSSGFEGYLITPLLKKQLVVELQNRNKIVTAIGDSMIDVPMLETADNGYIVAHQKLNNAVVSYFEWMKGSQIKQLFCGAYNYDLNESTGKKAI